ncbi:MAG: hypothetical protein KQH63_03435 [Desulfobulbaceae bacterium]|nr:hypothetical protein [Desulfobulbaceae bacterium]
MRWGQAYYYWSSSTNADNTSNAWNVNFNNGNVNNNNKNNSFYVRAVRGGKCELLSWASVYQAYLDCRRRKRSTINALKFEANLLENLFDLALELQNGTYRPSRSVCFVTTRPKNREIFAADFRDRIVHHLVVRPLEKIWEPRFIHDSYASRPGKGIHAATQRLRKFMVKVTGNRRKTAWYMQLDIRSFFMSIDKNILFNLLGKGMVKSDDKTANTLLYLLERIIFHDCTQDYYFKGNRALLGTVPAHKSLFALPDNVGLPIGNLTSQFFANVYLNSLDQFVKHVLNCRYYLRYVDDFVLLNEDKEQLATWQQRICNFLESRLKLQLKDKGRLRRVSDGADFLGYIVRPDYVLVRNRVVGNLKARLREFENKLVSFSFAGKQKRVFFNFCPDILDKLRQVLASYLGHFKHADSHRLIKSIFLKFKWLEEFFEMKDGRLREKYTPPRTFRKLACQYHFFKKIAADALLLFRIGEFYEMYDGDALRAAERLNLRTSKINRRGMGLAAGFPYRRLRHYIEKALTSFKVIVVVEEKEQQGRFLRDRYVNTIYRVCC